MALVVAALAIGAGIAGCGDDSDDTGDEASGDGAALYAESCASCHGSDLRGTGRGPSHLSEVYEPGHHSDESFRSAIRNGSPAHHWTFGDMPPIPSVPPAEVDRILAYVRWLQREAGVY